MPEDFNYVGNYPVMVLPWIPMPHFPKSGFVHNFIVCKKCSKIFNVSQSFLSTSENSVLLDVNLFFSANKISKSANKILKWSFSAKKIRKLIKFQWKAF